MVTGFVRYICASCLLCAVSRLYVTILTVSYKGECLSGAPSMCALIMYAESITVYFIPPMGKFLYVPLLNVLNLHCHWCFGVHLVCHV